MKAVRIILAFIVAATVAALLPFMGACAGTFIFTGRCDVDFGWSAFALGITLTATLVIAAPLFLLFWRLGWLSCWQVAVGGAIVGLVSPMALQILDDGSSWVWYQFAVISVPLGIISGLVFWRIGVHRNIPPT